MRLPAKIAFIVTALVLLAGIAIALASSIVSIF
jgi:hypothetical protein